MRVFHLQSSKGIQKFIVLFSIFLLLAMAATSHAGRLEQEEQPGMSGESPAVIDGVQEQVEAGGQYQFTAQVEQRLIPRPIAGNIGLGEERVDSQITADVTLPDQAWIDVRFEGAGDLPSFTLEQDGLDTYLHKDGERTLIENPLSEALPSRGYLDYVQAATNIRQVDNPDYPQYAIYTFDIDGELYADYMVETLQEQLPANEQNIVAPPSIRALTGSGELWVDGEGYPQRQILDLATPNINDQYDSQSHIVVDYDFSTALSGVTLFHPESVMGGAAESASTDVEAVAGDGIVSETAVPTSSGFSLPEPIDFWNIPVMLLLAGFMVLIVKRPRWFRVALPVTLAMIMLTTPILQKPAHAQENTDNPPTLTDVLGLGGGEPLPEEEDKTPPNPNTSQLVENEETCGSGDGVTDSDSDGTTDFVERCLGTNPYYYDTDGDAITDTLEIEGTMFGGQRFYSDPLHFDSNRDGLTDSDEEAAADGSGLSDDDGDGVPNLWDPDNDGDNIPDNMDDDPFHVTDYRDSFTLKSTLEQSSFDGYQYIEFAIQPENEDHLRYTTSSLDWPYDEKGNIQDLDNSTEDMHLIPFLKVTTPDVPDGDLLSFYQVSSYKAGNNNDELYVPLSPVSVGGRIVAFNGKIAYGPGQFESITWSDIELVWLAMMEQDKLVGDEIQTKSSVVARYTDPFRFASLEISKSSGFDYAILGTPNFPTDNRHLTHLMLGLEASFLAAVSPDLDEVVERFTAGNATITETWGLDAAEVAVATSTTPPEHYDNVAIEAVQTVAAFLDDNNYPQGEMVSYIMALEGNMGSASLADLKHLGDEEYVVNLADIPLFKMRSLAMDHYQNDGDGWRALGFDEIAAALQARYTDLDGILAAMQQDYPDLVAQDLMFVHSSYYYVWANSLSNVVAVDGITILPDTADDALITNQLDLSEAADPITYLIEANDLAVPGAGVVFADRESFDSYVARKRHLSSDAIFYSLSAWSIVGFIWDVYVSYKTFRLSKISYLGYYKWYFDRFSSGLAKIPKNLTYYDAAGNIHYQGSKNLWSAVFGRYSRFLKYKYAARVAKAFTIIKILISVIILAVELTFIWLNYANYHSIYEFERDYALAYAITATIVTVIVFILAFSAIGLIIVIAFTIATVLVALISRAVGSEFDAEHKLLTALTDLYMSVEAYTQLTDIEFEGLDIDLNGPLMEGSTVVFSDKFTGYIGRMRGDNNNELTNSNAYGWFDAKADSTVEVSTSHGDESCDLGYVPYKEEKGRKYVVWGIACSNDITASFIFNEAGINREVSLMYKAKVATRYEQCGASVFFTSGNGCKKKTDYLDLPGELGDDAWDWMEIELDVLPDTLDELWNWPALNNNKPSHASYQSSDSDGDGLAYSEEISLGTDPALWDSDGDGLSDSFEVQAQNELGANPLKADSDGDGLNDGLEFQIRTIIDDADGDDDGLTDGEEKFHWDGSQWTGGGWFIDINGTDYWVFSPAIAEDGDADNFRDLNELHIVAPLAKNEGAPRFTLDAGPLQSSPTGSEAVYVSEGQSVTATVNIINVGGARITDTLSLCLPATLSGVTITATGDRVPETQSNGDCYEWDFSGQNLTFLQEFKVEMSAVAGSETLTDVIQVSLPYPVNGQMETMMLQESYVQDNTAPTVELTSPISQSILKGDYFVMGGFSQDKESWVEHVEVTVPAGTFTAADTNPWAYTWELPDDGVVTVSAVAYDAAGNASAPSSVQVTVDSLAPVITSNLADGTTISAGQSFSHTIELNGTVTDNYSGLVRVQLRYNEQPWRTIWETDGLPLDAEWSGVWELPGIIESAQGEHRLHLRAYDGYGNVGTTELTVFVDLLPPTSDLTNRLFLQEEPRHIPINQQLELYGVASDAGRNPLPAGPAVLSGDLHSIGDATVWLQPEKFADDDSGITVAWIGDFNGDRLGDLAIGLPAAEDGAGKVVVVNGQAGDWPLPNFDEMDSLAGHKPAFIGAAGSGLGSAVQPAGDYNGDGFEDMLIGDPANNRLLLAYGSPTAISGHLEVAGEANGRWTEIVSNGINDTVTTNFAAAGDVNNDSLGDILVSVTDGSTGYVYLVAGNPNPSERHVVNVFAGAVLETAGTGASAAGVGDVNGDFIDDFAVAFGGTVYLFEGGGGWSEGAMTNLTTTGAMATFATGDALPTIVGLGDLDLDGTADFAFTNGSSPVVVFGSAGEIFATQSLGGFPSPLSGFLAAAGDVDKDGRGDLLIGNGDSDAYLILGSDLTSVEATIEEVESAASAPYIAGADLAGDRSSDLLLVPTDSAADDMGYDTLSQGQPFFINQNALPVAGAGSNITAGANSSGFGSKSGFMAGDVTVAPLGGDFTSIQAAIDSGAERVLVRPGVYHEAITLTNDVIVAGSGAGLSYLAFPPGGAEALVTADGVSNASLLNMTLMGNGSGVGVRVLNGATGIQLQRTVIRDLETAVFIDGSTAGLSLKNNTITGNVNGLIADNCAPVDVRNTIFAYHTGTALQYEGCAAVQNHQFNLYWANGTDMLPNDPGGGEIFSDPLFLDFGGSDFRVERISPVIDAGSPEDDVPPGAGSLVDIGHMEQTGAAFVASKDYCDTCPNDGLVWGVDAFNSIQDAVDAAEAGLLSLFEGNGTRFTVGVDAGVYTESVEINWNLQLLGSDPDKTTIVGLDGPAVTLSATVGTRVEGFTLIGGGAEPVGLHVTGGSYGVEIGHNLFKDNETGILIDGLSSGSAHFNTLIDNTTAVYVSGKYDWLDMNNNLISGNEFGLYAEGVTTTVVNPSIIGATEATGVVFSENNLLYNDVDYTNVRMGITDIVGVDPLITGDFGYLQVGSPAVDAGSTDEGVPAAGGVRADIGWHELRIPPISILMGQPDDSVATESIGVGSVEYAIVPIQAPTSTVTSTLPVNWTTAVLDNPGEKLTYWSAPFTPTAAGFYRIYSRAADTLGNAETNVEDWYEGAFYVDDSAPVVTLQVTKPLGVGFTWLRLTGTVTDYIGTSFDVDEVYFTINGERYDGLWSLAPWEPDGETGRKFHYFFMNETGGPIVDVQIQAFAVDGAGQVGSSAVETETVYWDNNTTYFDATPPRIWLFEIEDDTLPIPPYDVILNGNAIFFQGQARDVTDHSGTNPQEAKTGINGYQFSVDGGLTWHTIQASVGDVQESNGFFGTVHLDVPDGFDSTTIPMKIRVTDHGGLSRIHVFPFTVDTGAPRLVGEIMMDSETAVGMHLDQNSHVTFTWDLPIDGSNVIQMLGNFGSFNPNLPPTTPLEETTYPAVIDDPNFMALIGAKDEAGNVGWRYFGPWYHGQVYGFNLPWSGAYQSLYYTTDGILDIQHDEWLIDTEFLDKDDRPGIPQSLYATWDGDHSYVGWQGARWDEDGSMWVYWDLNAGGTTAPVSGNVSLPFEADYAFVVSDLEGYNSWSYNGTAWVNDVYWAERGHDPESRGTEVLLMFDFLSDESTFDFDHHRLFAYAENDSGEVWSAFPIINELDGDFDYYYEWPNLTAGDDLLKLPTTARLPVLSMSAAGQPPVQNTLTHGDTIEYVVEVFNSGEGDSENVHLLFTGSEGVNYTAVAGATCNNCAASDSWLVDLPTIPANDSRVVTVTAELDNNLNGLETVTTTVEMHTNVVIPGTQSLVHTLDLTRPNRKAHTQPGRATGNGQQSITGTADDGFGAGVEMVEVSLDGTNWQTTTGTLSWTAPVTIPEAFESGVVELYVRATDFHGQVSEIEVVSLTVDAIAPVMTPAVPELLGNAEVAPLSGAASDPAPAGAQVQSIGVQFDSDTGLWEAAVLGAPDGNGQQNWSYPWQLPNEDGMTHSVRFRATDFGGNVTYSDWFTTIVDTVAPVITVTQEAAQVTSGGIALAGLVTDGYAFETLSVTVYTESGSFTESIPVSVGNWSYALSQPAGEYWLVLRAEDSAGNGRILGPFVVEVVSAGFPGDPSCDGARNVVDALYIMQYEVGMRGGSANCPPEEEELFLPACDVNGDAICNVVDALFILQCEVGIANSLCPAAVSTESQVEGRSEEETAADAFTAAAGTESTIRPSARTTTIQIGSGEAVPGQAIVLPLWVHIPAHSSLTAVTLDITFNPELVAFDGCQSNQAAFNLSLCALREGDENGQGLHTVSISALAVSGVQGELLLAELSFTALAEGGTALTLTARAFEDGSGHQPRLQNGRLIVHPAGGSKPQ